MKMDRSRGVDIDRVSGRQNRIAGRGEILSQTWRKTEIFMKIHGNPWILLNFIDFPKWGAHPIRFDYRG